LSDRFYATVRMLSLPLLKGWLRLQVRGLDQVPLSGALLVVANHASYLDPAVLGRACPRKLHFLIKRAVYRTRGLQWFFRGMDSIPVTLDGADSASLRAALRLLTDGKAVGIFPEGGRALDGRLRPARIGAALLAARSGCPVVPVGIRGAFESMPPGAIWPRPGRVEVTFGPPYAVDRVRGKDARQQLEEVAARMMAEIERLLSIDTGMRSAS
jgi:1-acyl-sn-glycerol-3-phosphate acyltransferase